MLSPATLAHLSWAADTVQAETGCGWGQGVGTGGCQVLKIATLDSRAQAFGGSLSSRPTPALTFPLPPHLIRGPVPPPSLLGGPSPSWAW